jgi:predicted  nucleic acid-binding Zn-ribbon protein
MHPDLAKLIVLQAHDIEAKRLRDEMAALPKLIASFEAKVAATIGQRALIVNLIAQEDAARRRIESEVTALEHEAAFARAEITRLEDTELESMERSDALEAQRTLANAAVAEAESILARERPRVAELLAKDAAALAELDRLRQALRAEVLESPTGDASLTTYDRIARSKGTAISEGLNQKCTACQMMVRPQRWNDLRDNSAQSPSAQTLMTCENCGRLLYYDPARDSPQRKLVEVESIAAQIVRSL